MTHTLQKALLLAVWAVVGTAAAIAQERPGPRDADDPMGREALAFRETVRAAAIAKNRSALEAAYADNFSHFRDSGRIDLKGERITLLLSGESAIETAPEENVSVQAYEPGTAAVAGVSAIRDRQTGRSARFRWLTVYVKQADGWKVALSQASRLQPEPR
jgi:hypothetical protein